jgi:hypothetical protein
MTGLAARAVRQQQGRLTFPGQYDHASYGVDLGSVGSRKSNAWTILARE